MFDPEIVVAILAFAGIGVVGLTEMLKRLLKASGFAAYAVSFLVSAAATVFTLISLGQLTLVAVIVYTILVFVEANGIYKAIKK